MASAEKAITQTWFLVPVLHKSEEQKKQEYAGFEPSQWVEPFGSVHPFVTPNSDLKNYAKRCVSN